MRPIKIIYLVPSLIKAGPINVLYNIVRNLDRSRFEPVVVALSEHKLKHRNNKESFTDLGIEVMEFQLSKLQVQLHSKGIARRLQELYGGEHTIFHAHGYYPTLILAEMKGAYTMTTIHNICEQDFRMRMGRFVGTLMARSYMRALRKLSISVPICDSMCEHYREQDHRLHLSTVYNGVKSRPIPQSGERAAARQALGIPEGIKVFAYPAAFSSGKNHQRIIEEVKRMEREDVLILFAGQGEEEKACQALADGDSRFRFMGYQMDLGPLWQASDFMISASLSEGMPMAVLEALQYGLPCVLSNIPPHLEILSKVFGTDALSFDLGRMGSLAETIGGCMDKTYDAEKIQQRARIFYSEEAMCSGYMRLYEELVKEQNR